MRSVSAFVEVGVGMAYDSGIAAWVFDPDLWGNCGQATDEGSALRDLSQTLGEDIDLHVVERIRGDEQAFERDRIPCTPNERTVTVAILDDVREKTIAFLQSCTTAELDFTDHARSLPSFANWHTLRDMGWHIADTESRYYLPSLGLPTKTPATHLIDELMESARHVRGQLCGMPSDLVVVDEGEVWTTVKLLRRLAWHERSELAAMQDMLTKIRRQSC